MDVPPARFPLAPKTNERKPESLENRNRFVREKFKERRGKDR